MHWSWWKKMMMNGKEVDLTLITSDLLKWSWSKYWSWIMIIIDQAIKQGLSNNWFQNWIKPEFKAKDKILISNYHTIIVSSTIAMHYHGANGNCMDWKSKQRALGQVCFRSKHFMIDHLVILRVIIEICSSVALLILRKHLI